MYSLCKQIVNLVFSQQSISHELYNDTEGISTIYVIIYVISYINHIYDRNHIGNAKKRYKMFFNRNSLSHNQYFHDSEYKYYNQFCLNLSHFLLKQNITIV